MRLLVTGGMGFIGSNFVRYVLASRRDWDVINVDKLTYCGNPANLADVVPGYAGTRYWFIRGDVTDHRLVQALLSGRYEEAASDDAAPWSPTPPADAQPPEVVIHFAAESHVDRSILNPTSFLDANVRGTQILLEAGRRAAGLRLFIQVSTDEVYGPTPPGVAFDEDAPLNPTSPYAATKGAADLLCGAYARTYGVPIIIVRCTNNYGPFQYPEKFIPLVITNALEGQPIPIYGDGQQIRDWLHVEDYCAALCRLIEDGTAGEIYHVSAGNEAPNLEIARRILHLTGRPDEMLVHVPDRPGHDWRYALRADKIARALQWHPHWDLEAGLLAVVDWYRAHESWWRPLKGEQYKVHYRRWYGDRLSQANVEG